MSVSAESIINLALIELGASPITQQNEDSENARILRTALPTQLNAVIRAHPWNFAMWRASLPAMTETPPWGWAHYYELPVKPFCLRVWRVNESEHRLDGSAPYAVEGRRLLCDEPPPVRLRYIIRVEDYSIIDPLAEHAIALRLAATCCYRIPQSRSLSSDLWSKYNNVLQEARGIDAQEGTPEPVDPGAWLRSRA